MTKLSVMKCTGVLRKTVYYSRFCHVMESVTDQPAIVTNSNVWKSCLFYSKMEVIQERFVDIWVTN